MSTAVAERQESAVVPLNDSATLLQMISRAASDPTADIDKMERLMAMHERMVARQAETDFNLALTAAQQDMTRISADALNPQTRSKYVTYAKLDKELRPIYTRYGFALSFDEGDSPKPEHVRVLCHVSRGGHCRTYHKDMPADGKGAKGGDVMTKTHAAGAAMSYGMRYLLKGIFNVAVGEEDRDGNATTGAGTTISPDQVKQIEARMTAVGANRAKFMAWARVTSLDQIHANNFQSSMDALNNYGRSK
jgi:hypothetical protein